MVTVTVSGICGFLFLIRDQNSVAQQAMKQEDKSSCQTSIGAASWCNRRPLCGYSERSSCYMTRLRGTSMRHTAFHYAMTSRIAQIPSNILNIRSRITVVCYQYWTWFVPLCWLPEFLRGSKIFWNICGSLVLGPVSTAYFYSKGPEFVPRHRPAVVTDSCLGLSQDQSWHSVSNQAITTSICFRPFMH